MKRKVKFSLIALTGLLLAGCGVKNTAKKGYQRYLEESAKSMGIDKGELDKFFSSVYCVHINEDSLKNNYYYKAYFGRNTTTSTLYFTYYSDTDYVTESNAKSTYEVAYSLYADGYKNSSYIQVK